MEKVDCALCGSNNSCKILTSRGTLPYFDNYVFSLVQCKDCGLIYLNPRPAQQEISKLYGEKGCLNDGKFGFLERKVGNLLLTARVRRIMKYKKNGRILDIGCGDGEFLLLLYKKGWKTYGIDISRKACKLATDKLKQNILNHELKDCNFPEAYFDLITLNHVLEHLLDPNKELREIHRILKGRGMLLICVPNIGSFQFKISKEHWFGLRLPWHVYQYSPNTIVAMLKKNGFEVVKITYPSFDFPLSLFHSLNTKWQNAHSRLFSTIYFLPLILASIIANLFPLFLSWRPTIEVIARKYNF